MLEHINSVLRQYWGYEQLRPLQQHAIVSSLTKRDSLVVLPTGGGKSLCYQLPPLVDNELTVVVSPLIALMKDQVDGLRESGIAAVKLDSSQSYSEQSETIKSVLAGRTKLIFASPERMVTDSFQSLLTKCGVRRFAIDEAHCISHWGHDFRPEYRQLSTLKRIFPEASIHAYTATATQAVRDDIIEHLGLHQPQILVGDFDRANLTYRVIPRTNQLEQVIAALSRHENEPGIIYCLTRKNVETLTTQLRLRGFNVQSYHAGLTHPERTSAQEAFIKEECNIIVATIAFGMGIDRSNVRFVIHVGMPRAMECYQQEAGRAGRDGLESECLLFYAPTDAYYWKRLLKDADEHQLQLLDRIDIFCRSAICRHRALVEYFGQTYEKENCHACDVCNGDTATLPNSYEIARRIVECISQMRFRYGVKYISSVLRGEPHQIVVQRHHNKLSTFGALKNKAPYEVEDWINQIAAQGYLSFESISLSNGVDARVVATNKRTAELLASEQDIRLVQPTSRKPKQLRAPIEPLENFDPKLFEELRKLRRTIAAERNVAAYLIFSDVTLRDMAIRKPRTASEMLKITGVGRVKLDIYGDRFIGCISSYCEKNGLI